MSTLVNGSVNVSDSFIYPDSLINCVHFKPDVATVGTLYVSYVGLGNFTIKSSTTSDNNAVHWTSFNFTSD
jgi:hypothetical protein